MRIYIGLRPVDPLIPLNAGVRIQNCRKTGDYFDERLWGSSFVTSGIVVEVAKGIDVDDIGIWRADEEILRVRGEKMPKIV